MYEVSDIGFKKLHVRILSPTYFDLYEKNTIILGKTLQFIGDQHRYIYARYIFVMEGFMPK